MSDHTGIDCPPNYHELLRYFAQLAEENAPVDGLCIGVAIMGGDGGVYALLRTELGTVLTSNEKGQWTAGLRGHLAEVQWPNVRDNAYAYAEMRGLDLETHVAGEA